MSFPTPKAGTMRNQLLLAALAGQLLGLFGWIDPLYVLFVLLGPPVVGAVAAARRVRLAPVMVLWASAGLNMLWVDWVFAREDVVYHLVLSALLPLLATVGWAVVAVVDRRRSVTV